MTSSDSKTLTVRHVFIGSPGDLTEERRLFPEILTQVNKIKANALGIELKPLGWEDTPPGIGRPQELINEDVKKADLCVMLLWKRWGTPTGEYSSGFEEEYELARDLHGKSGKPDTWLFFRAVPQEMMADPGPQLNKVIRFRKKVEKERGCFYKHYEVPVDWEKLLIEHLCRWLDGYAEVLGHTRIDFPPDALERIGQLEKKLTEADAVKEAVVEKLRESALKLTRFAVNAAGQGRLTEAEQAFASAVEAYPGPEAINTFGLFLYQTGSLDRAIEKFQQLEGLSESLSDKGWAAIAYRNLGIIYKTRGGLDKAEEMYRKALAIDEELGHKRGMANAYGNLGNIYQTRGDLDKAEE
ncbi:MAG: tetratricopeptide repeat protein, partial [Chloroflexi bacterium]|nr:tetratricopeptide repeat protein [Chloroflexota bacterium]